MKYLLYYNLDSKFVTDQTNAGGDGTSVVSVVDGVAWCKDSENTYYRYSSNSGDIVTFTVTVHYVDSVLSRTIKNDDVYVISAYNGCSASINILAPEISNYLIDSPSVFMTLTGNTAYTFYYERENHGILAYYTKTGATSDIYSLFYWDKDTDLEYAVIDGQYTEVSSAWTLNGEIGSIHEIEFVFKDGINSTPSHMFNGCKSVKTIKIAKKFTKINGSFAPSSSLENLEMDGIETVGSQCFQTCSALTSVVFSKNVKLIDACAFVGCKNLTNVNLEELDELETIYFAAFSGCTSLQGELVLPKNLKTISSNFGEYDYNKGVFAGCTGITSVVLPNTLEELGTGTFYQTKITNIVLPASLKTMHGSVFTQCPIKSITSLATTPASIRSTTFYGIGWTGGKLYYPEGSNYSTWLQNKNYYLGLYGWTGVETNFDD